MRGLLTFIAVACAGFFISTGVNVAQAQKGGAREVVLKGRITCAKCELMIEKKCTTVIVVKEADKKETVYYFDKESHTQHHGDVCADPRNGTVIATVSTEGKNKVISVKKLTFDP